MTPEIIIAIVSVLGTVAGSALGVIASARLTAYRLQQLENKVNKHNNFAERIPTLESTMEHEFKHIYYELDELKGVTK